MEGHAMAINGISNQSSLSNSNTFVRLARAQLFRDGQQKLTRSFLGAQKKTTNALSSFQNTIRSFSKSSSPYKTTTFVSNLSRGKTNIDSALLKLNAASISLGNAIDFSG